MWDKIDKHKCPPRWRVDVLSHHDPDDATDGLDVYAADEEDAAQAAVEEWDECERDVLNGSVDVMVRPHGDLSARSALFEVTAEVAVEYTAHAKESVT